MAPHQGRDEEASNSIGESQELFYALAVYRGRVRYPYYN